jgi:hypothetical protein
MLGIIKKLKDARLPDDRDVVSKKDGNLSYTAVYT